MDQTEARYAEIARLMVETQNWVVLFIDYNVPFWAKPPLSTWAAALSILLFGTHAFFVRLPYLLVQLGIALGIQKVVSKDKIAPYLASIILFTLPEFYLHSGVVSTDVFLHLAVVIVMGSFWQMLVDDTKKYWGYLVFSGLSIGLLSKGPIIVLLTVPPIFLWTLLQKKFWTVLKKIPWFSGLSIMLIIALPWYVAVENASPGFLDYFISGEHFKRFFDSEWNGDRYGFPKQQPLGIIWLFLICGTLPWGFLAFRYLAKHFSRLKQQPRTLFLVCWLLWTPFFFTFSKSLIHTYTLPIMLPVAFLAIEAWPTIKYKKTTLAIASGIPLLLFLAQMFGIGKQVIENSTDKFLLPNDTEKQVYAYSQKSYSSQFYSQGTIKNIDAEQLQKAKATNESFYLLIEKRKTEQIDLNGLEPVKENKKKRLYYFSKLPIVRD